MADEQLRPESTPNPSLESSLAYWQERLDRLEAESVSMEGTKQYPEWWNEGGERVWGIKNQLQEAGGDPDHVSKYLELYTKEEELKNTIGGYERYQHPLFQVVYNLGEGLVGKALQAESSDGPLHMAALEAIEDSAEVSSCLTPILSVLRESYGFQTMTELLGVKGDEYSEKLHKVLLTEQSIRWIRYNDVPYDSDAEWKETQKSIRAWMTQAVHVATGMDTKEASDYTFSASRRAQDEDLISIVKTFDHFGVDRIRNLSKFTGIHGLEAYSIEQLERMENLVNDPEGTAEKLAPHDVNVILVNRFGDHNGVLGATAADFDDNGRTIFMEVSRMQDVYRRISALHKIGIKPSTLVLAAHSAPGQFMITDDREPEFKKRDIAAIAGRSLVNMANNTEGMLDPGERGYSIHGMKGLARIAAEYMQPSRAVDDPDDNRGRIKIIFSACHAGAEIDMADLDENGEKTSIGTESVISQIAKDLVASGIKGAIDLYGAPDGIQMHRTESGVRYSSIPTDFGLERNPLHAIRVRVEAGKIEKQEVDEIGLRKLA